MGRQPFLWIHQPIGPPPSVAELAEASYTRDQYEALLARIVGNVTRRLGAIDDGAMRVEFGQPGIDHIDFADEHFWDGSSGASLRETRRVIADTRAWLRAFAEGAVLDDWSALAALADTASADPGSDVTVHEIVPFDR